jgi:ribosomal protein RSM22 (predicted rRNA methylase)
VQLPLEIREAIENHAAGIAPARLARAAESLSDHYRARGNTAALPLSSEERVAAYLAVRFPATFAAAAHVFEEIRARMHECPTTSLLDLGAGPGAATLAARTVFPALREYTLIEAASEFASAARRLLPDAAISVRNLRNMETFPAHDLVVASYALGEMDEASRKHVLAQAWSSARVALAILEPGSPAGFALVREARRWLLENGARMLAPCPGEGACPMPANDWCHFAARVERTSLHRRLKGGALSYEDEKFSYVVVARQQAVRPAARVIRRPEQRPGLIGLTLCRGDAVSTENVTRRDPARFRAARHAEWGGEWLSGKL